MSEQMAEFVGGRQDGNKVPMADPPMAEVRCPLRGNPLKSEVYVRRDDGRYHFGGYDFATLPIPSDADERREWERELATLVKGLSDAVERLEEFCKRSGGYLNLEPLHGWKIQKTE